ncbi:glycosyltransferase family 39 protein [bacterium]|nr:glycosyltransferase family 39 protein [bacterium]
MTPFDPSSRSFRFIILPICFAYFLICVLFGGWPLNLIFLDSIFNSRIALILVTVCILHSRNIFQRITRQTVLETSGFFVIIGIGGYLRFKGIRNLELLGPTVDEPILVDPVLRMLRTGSYDFVNYEYGGVYFYVLAIAFILMIFRSISHFWYRNISDIPEVAYYTAGRMATAFFSLAIVACTYSVARKYFGKIPAIAASLILTFSALSFTVAHEVRLDFALALWILLAHLFFLRILDEPSSLNYTLAGIFCGLAIGTKYTVVTIFISFLIAHALSKKGKWLDWNLLLGLFCGIAVYILTNLYALMHLNTFLIRLTIAVYHNLNPQHWSHTSNRALEYTIILIREGIGLAALIAGLITLPRIFSTQRPGAAEDGSERRASERLLLLWTFPLLHLLFLGSYPSGFARYIIPVLPLLSILAGEGVRIILEWIKMKARMENRANKFVVTAALALLIAYPAWYSYRYYAELAKGLSPQEVITWVQKNIPEGSTILIDPTGPVVPSDHYKVTSLNYAQFKEPRNVKGFDYVCVTEDLFKRIPRSYEVLHEFPSRTKALDRSVRIYKAVQ